MKRSIVLLLACVVAGAAALAASPVARAHAAAPRLAPVGRRAAAAAVRMQTTEPKAAETNAEASDGSGGVRQLLGLKGAKEATGEEFLNWKIRLQLTKPATWVPLIWGVACGAAAARHMRSPAA